MGGLNQRRSPLHSERAFTCKPHLEAHASLADMAIRLPMPRSSARRPATMTAPGKQAALDTRADETHLLERKMVTKQVGCSSTKMVARAPFLVLPTRSRACAL